MCHNPNISIFLYLLGFVKYKYSLSNSTTVNGCISGVATGGSRGQIATPDSEKVAKSQKKRGKSGKIWKNEEKS